MVRPVCQGNNRKKEVEERSPTSVSTNTREDAECILCGHTFRVCSSRMLICSVWFGGKRRVCAFIGDQKGFKTLLNQRKKTHVNYETPGSNNNLATYPDIQYLKKYTY